MSVFVWFCSGFGSGSHSSRASSYGDFLCYEIFRASWQRYKRKRQRSILQYLWINKSSLFTCWPQVQSPVLLQTAPLWAWDPGPTRLFRTRQLRRTELFQMKQNSSCCSHSLQLIIRFISLCFGTFGFYIHGSVTQSGLNRTKRTSHHASPPAGGQRQNRSCHRKFSRNDLI